MPWTQAQSQTRCSRFQAPKIGEAAWQDAELVFLQSFCPTSQSYHALPLICPIFPHNCAWLTQEQVGWGCQAHQAHRPAPSVVNLMATWVRASISSCTTRVLDNVCGLHSWSIFASVSPDVPPDNMKNEKKSLLPSFDLFRCQFFQCGLLMLSLTSRSGVNANILSRRIPLEYSAGELEHQPNEEGWLDHRWNSKTNLFANSN